MIAVVAGSPAAAIENLNEQIAVNTAAFASAVGIAASNSAAIDAALNSTVRAASILGFANYLVANPLESEMTCFYADGEGYIINALALGESKIGLIHFTAL
jgi:hypothetical protein